MKRFKKILFRCVGGIIIFILLFSICSLLYRFTGSERTTGHPIFYIFPARSYPVNSSQCLAVGGYKRTPEFTTTPSCEFESTSKFHPGLLHCPVEGRIVKQQWCGDFSCSNSYYRCVINFPLEQVDQFVQEVPDYDVPSPEDVYVLARQFDATVTPDEFYMMSNAELYFSYGQYLAQQQQLSYQLGYILLSYAAGSDLRLEIDTETKLRELGFVPYDPIQSHQQPGIMVGFNADYYFAQQRGVQPPFDKVQIRAVGEIVAGQDLQLSAEQAQHVRATMATLEKSTPLPSIHCQAVYEQSSSNLIECVYGEVSSTTMQQYLVDAGVTDYTMLHYLSILVPYGQEDQWGKTFSDWEEFDSYQLSTF